MIGAFIKNRFRKKEKLTIEARLRRHLFRVRTKLLILGLLVWYLMHWLQWEQLYPVRLLHYFMPWFLICLFPAVIVAWVIRRLAAWRLVLTIPTLLIALPMLPLFLPRLGAEPSVSHPLSVMSYNICSANRDISSIVQVIQQAQPDLLLLEEVEPDTAQKLNNELQDLYPTDEFHYAYDSEAGQEIISRYLLTPIGVAPNQGRVQKVRADLPGGSVQVWNVHISQPQFWSQHYHEFVALKAAIDAVDGPLIVTGDFNTTDQSEMYRLLTQRLKDAHWEAGGGFGFTFPASSANPRCQAQLNIAWPIIRIDHIFYSHQLQAYRSRTLPSSGGSDHLPIMTDLSLEKQQ